MRITLLSLTAGAIIATGGTALADTPASDAYGGGGYVPSTIVTPPSETVTPVVEATTAPTVAGATATKPAATAAPTSATAPTAVASPTPTTSAPSGSLPFTGLDLTLIALGGLALIGIGFGARRISRPVS